MAKSLGRSGTARGRVYMRPTGRMPGEEATHSGCPGKRGQSEPGKCSLGLRRRYHSGRSVTLECRACPLRTPACRSVPSGPGHLRLRWHTAGCALTQRGLQGPAPITGSHCGVSSPQSLLIRKFPKAGRAPVLTAAAAPCRTELATQDSIRRGCDHPGCCFRSDRGSRAVVGSCLGGSHAQGCRRHRDAAPIRRRTDRIAVEPAQPAGAASHHAAGQHGRPRTRRRQQWRRRG